MKTEGYAATFWGIGDGGQSCRLMPAEEGLIVVRDDQTLTTLDYRDIQISLSGEGNRYVTFTTAPDGGGKRLTVTTPEKDIIDHIVATFPTRHFLEQVEGLRQATRNRHHRTLAVLLVLAGLLALLFFGVRIAWRSALDFVVKSLPMDIENSLGRTQAESILSSTAVCTDEELNDAIAEIGQRLTLALGTTPYQWRVRVLDSSDVNAYALPGGYVFINRGLIEASDDGHEVAGVLAHEFAHVIERHGIRNVLANMGLMLVIYAAVGDAGALNAFILQNLASLVSMSFSRSQETEADLSAVKTLYHAKLDPSGLARFMKKLSAEEHALTSVMTILSTHPGSSQRQQELESMMAQRGPVEVVPLKADWKAVQTRCNPAKIDDPDHIIQ